MAQPQTSNERAQVFMLFTFGKPNQDPLEARLGEIGIGSTILSGFDVREMLNEPPYGLRPIIHKERKRPDDYDQLTPSKNKKDPLYEVRRSGL